MPREMTITEKILAASAGLPEVSPGQLIKAKVDLAYTMDFMGKVVFDKLHQLGVDQVFDRDKVVVIFDHASPAPDVHWAELHNHVREEARKFGVPLYDVGRNGVMHHMVAQEGHLVPGMVALGTDSHAPTGGAMGAVALGIGATDIAVAMAFGEVWLRVPEAVRVTVSGDLPPGVMARDISTFLMGQKGWDGTEAEWTYRAIEFAGTTVEAMDMDGRFSLCNLLSDTGAKSAIVAPDEKTIAYARQRAKAEMKIFQSDPAPSTRRKWFWRRGIFSPWSPVPTARTMSNPSPRWPGPSSTWPTWVPAPTVGSAISGPRRTYSGAKRSTPR